MKKAMDLLAVGLLLTAFTTGAYATIKTCASTQSSVYNIVSK